MSVFVCYLENILSQVSSKECLSHDALIIPQCLPFVYAYFLQLGERNVSMMYLALGLRIKSPQYRTFYLAGLQFSRLNGPDDFINSKPPWLYARIRLRMYHFLLWFLQESSPFCMGIFQFFILSLTRIFFIWWNMLLHLLQSVFWGRVNAAK